MSQHTASRHTRHHEANALETTIAAFSKQSLVARDFEGLASTRYVVFRCARGRLGLFPGAPTISTVYRELRRRRAGPRLADLARSGAIVSAVC